MFVLGLLILARASADVGISLQDEERSVSRDQEAMEKLLMHSDSTFSASGSKAKPHSRALKQAPSSKSAEKGHELAERFSKEIARGEAHPAETGKQLAQKFAKEIAEEERAADPMGVIEEHKHVLQGSRVARFPNNQCGQRAKAYCSDFVVGTGKESECAQCIKKHIARLDAAPGNICKLSDVALICDVSMEGKSEHTTVACENELNTFCKNKKMEGPDCEGCVRQYIGLIDNAQPGEQMCSAFQIEHFCYFLSSTNTANEVEEVTVPDAITVLERKVGGGSDSWIARPKIPSTVSPDCAARVKHSCPIDAFPSADPTQQAKCVDCIKKHIGSVDAGGPAFYFACTLADVGAICSVSEKDKSPVKCENELKQYCKQKITRGPDCMQCVKEHLQRIDSGLVGESMCSSLQLSQFCFFVDNSASSAAEPGFPSKAEGPARKGSTLDLLFPAMGVAAVFYAAARAVARSAKLSEKAALGARRKQRSILDGDEMEEDSLISYSSPTASPASDDAGDEHRV